MKIGTCAKLLLLAAPILAGCANFWDVPGTGGGGGGGTSTLSSGVFYVLNQTSGQIAAYSIVSGKLTAVTGSPYTLASVPYSVAVAPNGKFLYVSTTAGIYLYSIGSGGALTLHGTSAISTDVTAYVITVDATNSWLLDASALGGLYAFAISPTDGTITSTTSQHVQLPGVTTEQQMVISPDNKNIFITQGSSGTAVVPFTSTANVATNSPFGTPTSIAVKGIGGAAISVAVDRFTTTRLFYIGETAASAGGSNTGGLRVFNYGTMTEITGSPYASGGLAPYSILPKTTGDYVYVANRTVSGSSTGNISGFAITTTGTTYSLTALTTTAAAGTNPVSLAEDSLKNYVLLVDSGGGPDFEGYIFNTTTAGKLDSVLTSTTGTDPVGAIAVVAAP